jgi:hypothetical protein
MPAQPSPRACTHVASAQKWMQFRGKARLPHATADAGGCGSAFTHLRRARKGPPVAAHCSHRGIPPPGARGTWSARAAEHAWPVYLGCYATNRSRRWKFALRSAFYVSLFAAPLHRGTLMFKQRSYSHRGFKFHEQMRSVTRSGPNDCGPSDCGLSELHGEVKDSG